MRLFDHEYFHKQFRMSPTKLEELLNWVVSKIKKEHTHLLDEPMRVTLRFLAAGDSQITG